MISIHELAKIQLKPAETVVSAVQCRDFVIVVTDRGTIYKIEFD